MKVYNAYKRAMETKGQPTVILAKTVKGYGLGEAGEGRNITHQQKKLNEHGDRALPVALRDPDSRRSGAQRVVLPAADGQPGDELPARAPPRCWAATCPAATSPASSIEAPPLEYFKESLEGSRGPRSVHHHGVRRAC